MELIHKISLISWCVLFMYLGIAKLLKKQNKKCKHTNKILMRTDYQDRYHLYGCVDCGEDLYEDMDEK